MMYSKEEPYEKVLPKFGNYGKIWLQNFEEGLTHGNTVSDTGFAGRR